jgi:hypothetical protein
MMKYGIAFVIAALAAASSAIAQVEDEIPEQRAYEGRMDSQVRSWIHEGNRGATDEEREFIREHWARAARLWRIRKLADAAHDAASVARVENLMARMDRILEEHIRRFREHAPVMTVAPSSLEVMQAPPPPQAEVQTPAPSPTQVWVPGFWQWNGSRHVWSAGHWMEPPQAGMTWEAPRWENQAGRYSFIEGRWRPGVQAAPTVVYEPPPTPEVDVQAAPPPPIVEVRPAGPPNAVWIPGYWHWSGARHVWVGGRWSAAKAGMRWEPDHWEHRGNQYHFVRGRWAR